MTMTRDERRSRVTELERWLDEQNAEFQDEAFPPEVRTQWDANNQELDEHRRVLRELDDREDRVRRMANASDGGREPGTAFGGGYGADGSRSSGPYGPSGPQIINRMSEGEVYNLDNVRFNPFDGRDRHNQELRDRAMRAVELARFPHPQATQAREAIQAHVSRLLDSRDTDDRVIARRILLTGSPSYTRAFAKTVSALLRGSSIAALTVEETKAMEAVRAMGESTGSAGGYAVPYVLDPTVIPTSNFSVNPFRAVCRVEQIAVHEWRGVTSAGVTATYATEAAEASDNSPTLAQPTVDVLRAECFVPVSIELTQDWNAIQGELAQMIQDAKDDLEANKFTNGSGTNEPTGILTGATNTIYAGGSQTIAAADLYNLEAALPPRFRPRAQWIGNRAIWSKVRQFDTYGGAQLWQYIGAGLPNQVPTPGNLGAQLLGYQVNEDTAMPSSISGNTKMLVLGDMRYYIIVDRIGLDIEVIPHLFGPNQRPLGQRGFFAFWRNNAAVLDPNGLRVLVAGT